ncbi:hypothetical protein F5Y17DRAFT_458307 [Xylariaceae sp. FL0594]|nr:hypothetical protein F5Y17DRAFT_458307 [Xylariaceae sp. FL0594]
MLGLFKASALFAPLLALASPLVIYVDHYTLNDGLVSSTSLRLPSGGNEDLGAAQHITLDVRVVESTTSCGYANITVGGQPLAQDDIGFGAGNITTEDGNVLDAEWKFSCVHLGTGSEEQLLSIYVDQIDGQAVEDVAFSIRFQQVAPVDITAVERAITMTTRPSNPDPESVGSPRPSLADELAELRALEEQLVALEHAIASKVSHISEKFGIDQPEELLFATDCHGITCMFQRMYARIKDMAKTLYHSNGNKSWPPSTKSPPHAWQSYTPSHGSQQPLSENDDTEKGSSDVASAHDPEHIGSSTEEESDHSASLGHKETAVNENDPHRRSHLLIFASVAAFLLTSVVLSSVFLAFIALVGMCIHYLRRRREARWEKRMQRVRAARESCNVMAATKYIDVLQWLRDGMGRQSVGDEEKHAEAQRAHQSHQSRRHRHHRPQQQQRQGGDGSNSGSDSEDALSTTMEEELAQFRAAAGVVSNLILSIAPSGTRAGAGGAQVRSPMPPRHAARPRRDSTDSVPSSIASAAPTYRTVDESDNETLPPYEEHEARCPPLAPSDHSVIADGFRYSPRAEVRQQQQQQQETNTRTSLEDRHIGDAKE